MVLLTSITTGIISIVMNTSAFFINNLNKITFTILIIIAAIALRLTIRKTLKTAFLKFKGKIDEKKYARTNTIRYLIVNIVSTIIFIVAVLTIMSTWGINVGPILTGIGIVGIALSFSSQSLVKDFISGFFIIIEDQFSVGDDIKVSTFEGNVKRIGIRSIMIKDKDGNYIYIPNSKIEIVTRMKPKHKTAMLNKKRGHSVAGN